MLADVKDVISVHVDRVALASRLEGNDLSDEQLVVTSLHQAGNDDAFEFVLVTDDELEADAAAKEKFAA